MSKLAKQILEERQASFDNLKQKRVVWDEAEQLLTNQLNDKVSGTTKSQVFDPKLATLALERSYRVMAQLPTGKVKGLSKNDAGDAKLKNLLLDKYILPNANAQFDFLTKMRMVDLYSNVYGSMYTLIDWDVKQNGYVGPDVWLLNIRDVYPQVGAVSLKDSDYVIVRTWKPLSYFEGLKGKKGYKNITKIIDKLKDKSGSKQSRDAENMSKREEEDYPQQQSAKNSGFYEVLTKYERDRWIDLCVDANEIFRDIENPHENGELPVDQKYSIPLLDDPAGLGDFQRGASMQKLINSNWNLYLDGVKRSIYPPMLVNKTNIASMSSLRDTAGAKWLVRNDISNAVQPVNLSPQGISTFNNVYQVGNAALLNIFGTTDTATTAQTDPGQGKTPEALKQLAARENTRDNADRFYMEVYLKSIMKKMVNLTEKMQTDAVTIRLFEEEIDQLAKDYPEIREEYDDNTGKLTVKAGDKSSLYDYEIVTGSTFAVDQQSQKQSMDLLVQMYLKSQTPQGNLLVQDLDKSGYKFEFGELFKMFIANGGIQDWDKILVEKTEQEKAEGILQNDQMKFQQMMQAMAGGGVPITPGQEQVQPGIQQ